MLLLVSIKNQDQYSVAMSPPALQHAYRNSDIICVNERVPHTANACFDKANLTEVVVNKSDKTITVIDIEPVHRPIKEESTMADIGNRILISFIIVCTQFYRCRNKTYI